MNTARESAVRLLKLMMIASLVLPAALFAYASWIDYRDIHAVADERIERSLDVQQEQALKVFETVDRTFAEVDEVVRGMSDDQIRAAQPTLHPRLERIADVMPQLQAIVLIGRDGRPLASSALRIGQDRRQFRRPRLLQGPDRQGRRHLCQRRAHAEFAQASAAISSICRGVWRRRTDRSDGVIAVAVRPKYFEDFYDLIGQTPGSFLRLVRADGSILARYPSRTNRSQRLSPTSALRTAIDHGVTHGDVHRQFRGRRRSPAHRLSQACRLSGLCARRHQHRGDQPRMVRAR